MIERGKGTIDFNYPPDGGTVVTLTLPVAHGSDLNSGS